jgi:hypothetical protein
MKTFYVTKTTDTVYEVRAPDADSAEAAVEQDTAHSIPEMPSGTRVKVIGYGNVSLDAEETT